MSGEEEAVETVEEEEAVPVAWTMKVTLDTNGKATATVESNIETSRYALGRILVMLASQYMNGPDEQVLPAPAEEP